MCGIVGTLSLDPAGHRVTEAAIVAMRDTMAHRGPDGAGVWVDETGRIGLGHRRLSIIDLSPSAGQPMFNEDGSLAVVFNGEIYNHADIRCELESLGGHVWRTDHSDTEVILHAFEQWGMAAFDRFRGMFAVVLWDARKGRLLLVRDRIGIKPLYWTRNSDRFSFASEIKALNADPGQMRSIDRESLFHFLSFTTVPAPRTMFEGIFKLEAGCWLEIDSGGQIRQGRWWDAWQDVEPLVGMSEAELAERLMAELRVAVALRKVSDVPSGVFLSGGVDSSTNLVLFAEGETQAAKAFSITYSGQSSVADEMGYARRVAAQVGAEHHIRTVTEDDLLGVVDKMVWLQDEPIADPVCVPVYLVAELARQNGVTVCHVGEGADELFSGYPHWGMIQRLDRANALPIPRRLKRLGYAALALAGRGDRAYAEYLRRAGQGLPIFWGSADAFFEPAKFRLMGADMRRQFAGRSSWEALAPIHADFQARAWEKSALHWMTYLDLRLRLPELLLMRVDKMTMGTSIEARVPFLDHKVVSLALSMPSAAKTLGGVPKRILKTAVTGLLPDDVIHRRKQGFSVPVGDWVMSRLGARVRSELDAFISATGLLDSAEVESLFRSGDHTRLWVLFNLALWWRRHVLGQS